MSVRRRGRIAVAVVTAAMVTAAIGVGTLTACGGDAAAGATPPTATSASSSSERLALADPSGAHAVGRERIHLVDHSRRDPWAPERSPRELMVSMYYPAIAHTGKPGSYMSVAGARAFMKQMELEIPAEVISSTEIHSNDEAKPAPGARPLVVLSPGFKTPGATLTGLAQDLASRGYVVAVVDHAYEAAGVSFTGKGILPCAACGKVTAKNFEPAALNRAEDLSFVLDRLTAPHAAWSGAHMIDKRRIGIAGHSLGGAAAAATMAQDSRIKAAVNLDGPFTARVAAAGLGHRPVLMMGTRADHSPGGTDRTWDGIWKHQQGFKRWLTVTGADHFAFTDLAPLAGQLGADDPDGLSGKRAGRITDSYVGAFFDQQLRGKERHLLDGPSAANPEVRFVPAGR